MAAALTGLGYTQQLGDATERHAALLCLLKLDRTVGRVQDCRFVGRMRESASGLSTVARFCP
jgi:hypothetical protein